MFRGRYEHTMTDKGRISVPAKFRDVLNDKYGEESLIITNFDRCLIVYPLKEWNEIERRAAELPQFKQEVISFLRHLIGNADDSPIDGQGRILLPQSLRNHAQIKRDVVMIGMLTKFEIWAKEIWDEEESKRAYEEFKRSREILSAQGL
ncbi:MAG: Protein MraZ protein [Candidatus Dadabacteria bacterium CSP1-2]|jgi:MraZ protein|uniref:Transcriptional regulator MraZ n=1 Tax=Candidatus Woesebacteria bacterium RBG_19FT_COMBO_37_29 TaxID=1802486 RepID=A0A1F7XKN5_9BACT|nr:MAG: Protein MraZ protein [Candidatus Dadabacteria bacterium CSP1-2]OGM15624.1 MAG: division/cell wall cluster transcriptional repressor MraZ [Candidatus Woesebacteria bacterium RBG_19FT_COMBO_37_29]